jgi:hypothetical protein
MKPWSKALAVVLALAVLALGLMWWRDARRATPAPATPPVVQPVPTAAPASVPAPAIEFPIAPADSASQPAFVMPTPENTDAAVQAELIDLAGRDGVLGFLQLDGFVRRVVATVDNLDRQHAPARVWPVNPTPGRFGTVELSGIERIAPDNAKRYDGFVNFVESVDMARAAALYRWMYPLFQRSYEELGYPGKYFNDRLVKVVDHLLATRAPPQPVPVTLLEIKGPVASQRPWVHYRFTDPALEQASAGQKLLMRMGPDNQARLQAKLAEFRSALVSASKPR